MKKMKTAIIIALVLALLLSGCVKPATETEKSVSEIESSISDIDKELEDLDLSELDDLDKELAEIEQLT